jgi:phosphatidylglycerol:prolipoprotein diacylglycerol transferase
MIDILNFIHWNINPEIFNLGPLSVRWYGLFFATGFLFGYYMVEKMFKLEKIDPKWLDSLFFYMIIATVLGARFGHVFFYSWDYYSQNPSEILKVWHGGLASHGGAVGILVAMFLYSKLVSKRSMLWALDRVAVPTALVGAFIRSGNLMNSEIYGVETSLPWGFIFERNGELMPKHPTQLYEALAYLLAFGVLYFLYWKKGAGKKEGLLSGAFFAMIFGARFCIEFIKENQEIWESDMTLNMGQWLSIPLVLFGLSLVVRAIKNPEKVYKNTYYTKKQK